MQSNTRLGFMQGRLSPIVGGRIQAFPWDTWRNEFFLAHRLGLSVMEWTLDHDRLYYNPLLTPEGQCEIRALCEVNLISIPSLTGDCFMQVPFWKAFGQQRDTLKADFLAIAYACAAVRIQMVVVPLVDNGRLENVQQEDVFLEFMDAHVELFRTLNLRIIFESDLPPRTLARLMEYLPADVFGINYDIGNSAASGYNPEEEFQAYGSRILNVHVKDRLLGGTTVPLGTGNADFPKVFHLLNEAAYEGCLIMQTARAKDGEHAEVLSKYMRQIEVWLQGA